MFRHIQLKIGRVVLGELLPASIISATGAKAGDVNVQMPAGSFGRAQGITLRLTPSGVLQSAEFDYPADADFEKMIGEYVSLGAPVCETERRGETTVDVARWADADTELVLTREVQADRAHVRGELIDRRALLG